MRYFERFFCCLEKYVKNVVIVLTYTLYMSIHPHMYVVSLSPAMYPCCHYHVVFKLLFQLFKKRKKLKKMRKIAENVAVQMLNAWYQKLTNTTTKYKTSPTTNYYRERKKEGGRKNLLLQQIYKRKLKIQTQTHTAVTNNCRKKNSSLTPSSQPLTHSLIQSSVVWLNMRKYLLRIHILALIQRCFIMIQ